MENNWIKPGIKSHHVGCLCCGGNEQLLNLGTELYQGFGGWNVMRNGELFYWADNDENVKTIKDIEMGISDDDKAEYIATLELPLRGGQWQRHERNKWVLIEENQGFA